MLYVNAILNTVLYLAVSGILTVAFLRLYVWITPYDEFELIRQGNLAAALSLSGTLLGFVLPLASVIVHSSKLSNLILWALIGMAVQTLCFFLVDWLLKDMNKKMPDNNVAAGAFLGAASLAAGILTTACLVP